MGSHSPQLLGQLKDDHNLQLKAHCTWVLEEEVDVDVEGDGA